MNAAHMDEEFLPNAEERRQIIDWAKRVLHEARDVKERVDAIENRLGESWFTAAFVSLQLPTFPSNRRVESRG